jgi:heme/copper-type cytochrome/quinol oxidase subunit 2
MVLEKRNNYNQRINLFIIIQKNMQTKNIMIAFGVLLVLIGGYLVMSRKSEVKENNGTVEAPVVATAGMPVVPANGETPTQEMVVTPAETQGVKEFTMTSWMDKIDGKMAAHFSLKEIVVKKGDKVRINITNTAGDHNFIIDAYGIKSETPLNKEVVVEFTADKAGDFEFYCSKYNHRTIGQTGTLRVIE